MTIPWTGGAGCDSCRNGDGKNEKICIKTSQSRGLLQETWFWILTLRWIRRHEAILGPRRGVQEETIYKPVLQACCWSIGKHWDWPDSPSPWVDRSLKSPADKQFDGTLEEAKHFFLSHFEAYHCCDSISESVGLEDTPEMDNSKCQTHFLSAATTSTAVFDRIQERFVLSYLRMLEAHSAHFSRATLSQHQRGPCSMAFVQLLASSVILSSPWFATASLYSQVWDSCLTSHYLLPIWHCS